MAFVTNRTKKEIKASRLMTREPITCLSVLRAEMFGLTARRTMGFSCCYCWWEKKVRGHRNDARSLEATEKHIIKIAFRQRFLAKVGEKQKCAMVQRPFAFLYRGAFRGVVTLVESRSLSGLLPRAHRLWPSRACRTAVPRCPHRL